MLYIKASVGLNGRNLQPDVRIIQSLINYKVVKYPGISKLKVDGKCGSKTRKSIEQFQRKVIKMHSPDARVDPNGRTEKALAASLTPFQNNQIKTIRNQPIQQINTTISNVTQPDQVSCGYYAGYAVLVVNRAGGFRRNLPMAIEDVETARNKYSNPNTYLWPMIAPSYLNNILKVRVPYKNSDSRKVSQENVRNCLISGRAMMLGNQNHWIALVAMDDQYTITVYNPSGKKMPVIDIMPLDKIVHWPYLVHPVNW